MMEWLHDPRLWAAATPLCAFIGAAFAFYFATESGDEDPVPEVLPGDSDNEPWGRPYNDGRKYRLPGDSVQRTNRVIEHDTAMLSVVKDERNHDLAEVRG